MGDIVPHHKWDWEREYEEIRQELTRRWNYRMGGRPYPTELTNAEEIIQTLERMRPILKRRVNEELKEQAVSAMQRIAETHTDRLAKPSRAGGSEPAPDAMPRTPSELQLEQVWIMQYWASKDAKDQDTARWRLQIKKYCGTECPYPDACGDSTYRGNCILRKLGFITPAPWWKKMVGQRFVPVYPYTESECYPLKRIRHSQYYEVSHEPRLRRIWAHGCRYEPELCRIWARELLGRIDNRCAVCRKGAYELTGCRPSKDPVY